MCRKCLTSAQGATLDNGEPLKLTHFDHSVLETIERASLLSVKTKQKYRGNNYNLMVIKG